MAELQTNYPFVDWLKYVNQQLPGGVTVHMSESIVVKQPGYFERLGSVLEATPKRTIANYLVSRAVYAAAPSLEFRMRDRVLRFRSMHTGVAHHKQRHFECASKFNEFHGLGLAVAGPYIREHFNATVRAATIEMFERIRADYKRMVEEATWMDERTRKATLDELNVMTAHVGCANEMLRDDVVDAHFADLKGDSKDFLHFNLALNRFRADIDGKRLREVHQKDDWRFLPPPTVVEACYS